MLRFSDHITGEEFGRIDESVLRKYATMQAKAVTDAEFAKTVRVPMLMGFAAEKSTGPRLIRVSDGTFCGLVCVARPACAHARVVARVLAKDRQLHKTMSLYALKKMARAVLKCVGDVDAVRKALEEYQRLAPA